MKSPDHNEPIPVSGIYKNIRPFASYEGRIFFSGLVLSVVYVLFLAISYFVSPQNFQVFTGITVTNILFGRAAGMSFGYALGFGHLVVLPINLLVETIMVLLIYPLFVFSWKNLLVIKRLDNFMHWIERAAEANKEKIRRYGIPSLFLFVLIPFWMTGPVVGCVIGFFLGIRPLMNITIVIAATAIACAGWAVLLKELHERTMVVSPFAPLILLAFIIIAAVAGYMLEMRQQHDKHKNQ